MGNGGFVRTLRPPSASGQQDTTSAIGEDVAGHRGYSCISKLDQDPRPIWVETVYSVVHLGKHLASLVCAFYFQDRPVHTEGVVDARRPFREQQNCRRDGHDFRQNRQRHP